MKISFRGAADASLPRLLALVVDQDALPQDLEPAVREGAKAARFAGRVEGVARAHDVHIAANAPYSGGYILERHGEPRRGVHALQLEFDRSLYLDAALDAPGAGLERTIRLLRGIIDAVTDEALPRAIAAE